MAKSSDLTVTVTKATSGGTTVITLDATTGMKMYFAEVPFGTFTMGSPVTETYHQSDETEHQVTISKAFFMGAHEVTQEQYQKIMGTNPSYFTATQTDYSSGYADTASQPVEQVSWFDAVRFCNGLSVNQGLTQCYTNQGGSAAIADTDTVTCDWTATGYRLPTEAEWEYSCRAGTTSMYYWANVYDEAQTKLYAWFWYNCGGVGYWTDPHAVKGGTQPVGTRTPNLFGLYDMSGNVWEWCWDWYDSGYYNVSPGTDPKGTDTGSYRVLRGGSWFGYSVLALRSAYRDWGAPTYRLDIGGFRVCRPRP